MHDNLQMIMYLEAKIFSSIIAATAIFALTFILRHLEYGREIIKSAKFHGITIGGEHYKVYTVYRESSYTDGGVYVRHHAVKYFGEMMIVSPKGDKIYISERHLRYCLKKRKHSYRMKIDDKWTYRWAEWEIDWNKDDDILNGNDIYLPAY